LCILWKKSVIANFFYIFYYFIKFFS